MGEVAGEQWWIGNRVLAGTQRAALPNTLSLRPIEWEDEGQTVLFYGTLGTVRGLISLGDAARSGAREAVERLERLGLSVEVISGDAEATTQSIARAVGIAHATARMRPADKIARVRAAQEGSRVVAMAGDGINDAPALAQADVGIAFGSGTEIARRAADITLVGDDLSRLADLFTLSRRTARVIRQNLFWACGYNAVCIPLAVFTPWINPLIAAGAMLVSSLSVVLNSKRLRRQLERS